MVVCPGPQCPRFCALAYICLLDHVMCVRLYAQRCMAANKHASAVALMPTRHGDVAILASIVLTHAQMQDARALSIARAHTFAYAQERTAVRTHLNSRCVVHLLACACSANYSSAHSPLIAHVPQILRHCIRKVWWHSKQCGDESARCFSNTTDCVAEPSTLCAYVFV